VVAEAELDDAENEQDQDGRDDGELDRDGTTLAARVPRSPSPIRLPTKASGLVT
jgi:hypothetical protein